MMRFREFLSQAQPPSEETQDIQKTLSKLPPSHAALVQGFDWKFHAGNTLNGDSQHVGYVDDRTREIAVAAPWNYGREFTILHEVAHKVWDRFVAPNPNLVQEWTHIVARTKHKQVSQLSGEEKQDGNSVDQEPVEVFCMAYAQAYAKNKLTKFENPAWQNFILQLPQ